jgi:hypothetical protein
MVRHNQIFAAMALAGTMLLGACGGMPQHAQTRVALVSSVVFQGGPKGALILIDGQGAGQIDGKQTRVAVPEGTHTVTVMAQGQKIWEQAVFAVDGSQKVIQLTK